MEEESELENNLENEKAFPRIEKLSEKQIVSLARIIRLFPPSKMARQ